MAADPRCIRKAVSACLTGGAFLEAIRAIYAAVDCEVESLGVSCDACGRCCRFDLAGHRLYASAGELALLSTVAPPEGVRHRRLRCPYQVGPLCAARDVRPLGCRAFYCGPETRDRTADIYERYHAQLRRLHERHSVPYAYAELTESLRGLPEAPDIAEDEHNGVDSTPSGS